MQDTKSETKEINEHTLQMELQEAKIEKFKNEWSCCCSNRTTDKDFMMFIASTIILISIMGFSMGQIIRAPPEKDTTIYFNLISFVAGIFISPMRHPSNNDKNN